MRFGDIDIPSELLKALRDNKLVIFAGAGVSMGAPANLPDFTRLASLVAAGTGKSPEDPVDRFLGNELDKRFFLDERKTSGGIRLTEDFYRLAETQAFNDLKSETEARWRLVETAWELNLPRHVVQITYDENDQILHTLTNQNRRVNITSSRDALNGYQKGRCFYCYRDISLDAFSSELADVDHFFPHKLIFCAKGKPIDGVANLVLSCKECNRGAYGKFERLPVINLLERLYQRNEYLIKSHHPLRETLMLQTGITEADRRSFLQNAHDCASTHLIMKWAPKPCGVATF